MKKIKWKYRSLDEAFGCQYFCMNCGASYIGSDDLEPQYFNFCPNCGGEIEGEFEEIKNECQ